MNQPPYREPAPPPPQPPRKRPWYIYALIVLGWLVAVSMVLVLLLFGFIAFACSRH